MNSEPFDAKKYVGWESDTHAIKKYMRRVFITGKIPVGLGYQTLDSCIVTYKLDNGMMLEDDMCADDWQKIAGCFLDRFSFNGDREKIYSNILNIYNERHKPLEAMVFPEIKREPRQDYKKSNSDNKKDLDLDDNSPLPCVGLSLFKHDSVTPSNHTKTI